MKKAFRLQALALIVLCAFVSLTALMGCSSLQTQKVDAVTGEVLTPVQKASVLAEELMKQYTFLYRQVSDVLTTGTEGQKAWLRQNVTRRMDEAKRVLKAYTEAVVLWRSSGEMPEDMYERERLIRSLLETIVATFIGGVVE